MPHRLPCAPALRRFSLARTSLSRRATRVGRSDLGTAPGSARRQHRPGSTQCRHGTTSVLRIRSSSINNPRFIAARSSVETVPPVDTRCNIAARRNIETASRGRTAPARSSRRRPRPLAAPRSRPDEQPAPTSGPRAAGRTRARAPPPPLPALRHSCSPSSSLHPKFLFFSPPPLPSASHSLFPLRAGAMDSGAAHLEVPQPSGQRH